MRIRPLTPADKTAHDALLFQLDTWHHARFPHLVKAPGAAVLDDVTYQTYLKDQQSWLCGMDMPDAGLVGILRMAMIERPEGRAHYARRFARIEELFVAEAFRGQGLGYALLDAAKEWARVKQADYLDLSLYAANQEALAFYHRAGFGLHTMGMRFDLGA